MSMQNKEPSPVDKALSGMILSHSGWRGVFAVSGDEEDKTEEISEAHRIIAASAALVFAEYLRKQGNNPLVLIGTDTRPTASAIAEAMISALSGNNIRYAGIVAAPEIMAWARHLGEAEKQGAEFTSIGFIYISASHNPIGDNGFKFGMSDGGVLPAEEMVKLTENFRALLSQRRGGVEAQTLKLGKTHTNSICGKYKEEAFNAYFNFSTRVTWNNDSNMAEAFRRGAAEMPIGVCCDFNGSARCASIDRKFFENMGMLFEAINAQPGEIKHRIVPEGESLEPCRLFLEEQHRRNAAFVMGYTPDCDGDRGNLVIWDEAVQKARALEAQEVFAIACIAEFAQLAWSGELGKCKAAIVVNDPTSLRIDRIAEAFAAIAACGVAVYRAEVGEANVVSLARRLRSQGFLVRILGEGSAGGNITHPSAVRDPLHTVMALAKLLSVRTDVTGGNVVTSSNEGKPGLFALWCNASGQMERCLPGFSLADLIASLPPFVTTSAYSPEALLKITSADHGVLKSRYQKIFLREWEKRKGELMSRYGIHSWEAAVYNGMEERKGIADFGEAGRGGLKICFYDANVTAGSGGTAVASLWMRGSATEPVFRIMADAANETIERDLIDWQRRMVLQADSFN